MVQKGITVSTVGCGPSFNEQELSEIAALGRGKFHPAFNPQEIPQVFTIEAERVIRQSGARHRRDVPPDPHRQKKAEVTPAARTEDLSPPTVAAPTDVTKPPPAKALRPALPAPYLRGISIFDVPGIPGHHLATPRPGAWVALETEDGDPVLAHGFAGYGRVIAMTLPLEGPWAAHLVAWDDYHVLAAQMTRFLQPDDRPHRWHVEATGLGRAVRVRIADLKDRLMNFDGLDLRVTDESGAEPAHQIEGPLPDGWMVRLDPRAAAAALRIAVSGPGNEGDSTEVAEAYAMVVPPPEVQERQLSLPGLERWAQALGGTLAPAVPARLEVPERRRRRLEPWGQNCLPWLLPVLLADLLLKRLFPGRLGAVRQRGRSS
jgi:hypothetical protein